MRSEPLLILILGAPSNHAGRNSTGIWGVNRQGCRFSRPAPWMARGGGPPNHWRITGTPSLSEVPSGGARAFCLLLSGPAFRLFKSEPPSGRNPKWPLPQQWICPLHQPKTQSPEVSESCVDTHAARGKPARHNKPASRNESACHSKPACHFLLCCWA